MLDWSKSEIKLLTNGNYVDNEPASKKQKTKQLNLNQNKRKTLHMLEGLVESLSQTRKQQKHQKHQSMI